MFYSSKYFIFLIEILFLITLCNAGLEFKDITKLNALSTPFRRGPGPNNVKAEEVIAKDPVTQFDFLSFPGWPRGEGTVIIIDYNNDGHEDIYVTNGKGFNNSLYRNDGNDPPFFTDVGFASGTQLNDVESGAVCFGDLNNDGWDDIYVGNWPETDHILKNNGDGTFSDVTASSGITPLTVPFHPFSCSMGDVNNDGLLDIAVTNIMNMTVGGLEVRFDINPFNGEPIVREPKVLLKNIGNFQFVNDTSPQLTALRNRNWAVVLVDYDLDGDMDWVISDDQVISPNEPSNPIAPGWTRFFDNNGTGFFTEITADLGLEIFGPEGTGSSWMGFDFADYNCDGHQDFFSTNFGTYTNAQTNRTNDTRYNSRWFTQKVFPNGTRKFINDASAGGLNATPFGWGCSFADFDLDGDPDLAYFGNFHVSSPTVGISDNEGIILINQGLCTGNFFPDFNALSNSGTDYLLREVHGVCTGDLNGDGLLDIVTASTPNINVPTSKITLNTVQLDSPWDNRTFLIQQLVPHPTLPFPNFLWDPNHSRADGELSIELSVGAISGHYIKVKLMGTFGITTLGKMNRNGFGGTIFVTPKKKGFIETKTTSRPVLGGASQGAQDSSTKVFGLAESTKADIEIFWPSGSAHGGTWNALFGVVSSSFTYFPEIPCDFKSTLTTFSTYQSCVKNALDELMLANVLNSDQNGEFLSSAIRAYHEFRITI